MTRTKTLAALCLLALAALAPVAQAQREIEVTPTIGYRFGGTSSTASTSVIESIDVPDSMSFGLTVEVPVHPSFNVEFLWSHQDTELKADFKQPPAGVDPRFSNLFIDTFQIGGLWQSGRSGDKVRGYLDLLLGVSLLNPSPEYSSLTRFSGSIGGGAKFQISDKVGVKLGLRWMPVYLSSQDSGYYWCDPYWGCYEYYDSNYLYQTDASVGVTIKF